MFSKANKPKVETPPVQVAKRIPPSIVAEDMEMVGNITSKGDVQLDGRVQGDITSNKLTVGENATITGTIFGDEVRIAGDFVRREPLDRRLSCPRSMAVPANRSCSEPFMPVAATVREALPDRSYIGETVRTEAESRLAKHSEDPRRAHRRSPRVGRKKPRNLDE